MAHFTAVRPGGWATGYSPTSSEWAGLDANAASGINGDMGGCWAPSAPITIDSTNFGGSLSVTGPVTLFGSGVVPAAAGGAGTLKLTGTSSISLAPADWPNLAAGHNARTRKFVTPCISALAYPKYAVRRHVPYGALQVVAGWFSTPSGAQTTVWRLPLRVADGSTLTSVAVTYRPLYGNPTLRVERVDKSGTSVALTSLALAATSGGANNSDGSITATRPAAPAIDPVTTLPVILTVTIPVDGGAAPSQAVIDISQYSYFLRVTEDAYTSANFPYVLSVYAAARLATTGANISLTGAQSIDGVAVVTGDRILVKDQTDSTTNGVYIASTTGAWTRAPDLAASFTFGHGDVVPIQAGASGSGNTLGNTYWQLRQASVPTLGTSPINYVGIPSNPLTNFGASFAAYGNIYYSAIATCTNITDDRWQ